MGGLLGFGGVCLLLAAGLAGCVGGGGPKAIVEGPKFNADTGSLAGSVIDEELRPVVGAQATILNTAVAATSNEAGKFFLNFVPPGAQTVVVRAEGYLEASKPVTVALGDTVPVDIALIRLPSDLAYHTIDIHRLTVSGYVFKTTPDCMYPVPGQASIKSCVGGRLGCTPDECEIHYGHCGVQGSLFIKYGCDFNHKWETIIGEVAWAPSSAVSGHGWIYEILAPNVTRSGADTGSVDQSDPRDFLTITNKSPIKTWVDREALKTRKVAEKDWCCDFVWRLFPGWCELGNCDKFGPDVGIMYEQSATVYFTYFVGAPAPKSFTALED